MKQIIGDKGQRKRRYDPNLARKVNEAVRKGELENKSREEDLSPIEIICEHYEEFMKNSDNFWYQIRLPIFVKKGDIYEFSRRLANYKDLENFGHTSSYLNHLLQQSEDDELTLHFGKLNEAGLVLDNIGENLEKKKLLVLGNVGDNIGYGAKKCRIEVHGNAGSGVGFYAQNSRIAIHADAGTYVGSNAKDCKIYLTNYESLARNIETGTEVYKKRYDKFGNVDWDLVYPEETK